jgi:hypothetical protein
LEQLGLAAGALLHNTRLILSEGFDPRQLTLVFCSHLFGAGKTAFAHRLFRGMQAAFRGKMSYALSMGIPLDSTSIFAAVARMVINGAECAGVISNVEALRLTSCGIASVVTVIQDRLITKENVVSAVSELFLHFDEFDLSNPAVLRAYPSLRSADSLERYDIVWQQAFFFILRAPNLHLIITGRAPELAILGTRAATTSRHVSTSPTVAFQVVLGTLHSEHIVDILQRVKVQTVEAGAFMSAFDVLGFNPVGERTAGTAISVTSSGDEGRRLRFAAFLEGLRRLTAGVPRYICLALGELLRKRANGSLAPFSLLRIREILALFDVQGAVCASLSSSPFVSQSLDELRLLITHESTSQGFIDDFYVLAVHVYSGRKVALRSVEGGNVIRVANKFCAYIDFPHDRVAVSDRDAIFLPSLAIASNPEIVVSLPGISEQLLRKMSSLLLSRMSGLLLHERPLKSAGAIGEILENSFDYAMEFNWTVSAISGSATARLASLLSSWPDFLKLRMCFDSRQVRYCMGKVLRANLEAVPSGKRVLATSSLGFPGLGLDDERRCVNVWIPRLIDVSHVDESVHIAWTPLPASHSADRMYSWVVRDIDSRTNDSLDMASFDTALPSGSGIRETASSNPRSLRVLAMFAFKHVMSGQLDRTELCEELRNIADTVCSLTDKQKALYGGRIVLYLVAYPSDQVPLYEVLRSSDALFPDKAGRNGAPGTEALTFSTLPFKTVLVSHTVLHDFLTEVPPAVAAGARGGSAHTQAVSATGY